MDAPLEGRVAIVTGGGSGIGRASSVELARQGARVVVADPGVGAEGEPLGEPTAAETAEIITRAGGEATSTTVDVTDAEGVRDLVRETRARLGAVDIVVNPAGIVSYAALPDTTFADWSSVLRTHVDGYLNVLRAALPVMVEQGHGRVVGFTSGVGVVRSAGGSMIYGAAKRSVAALTWRLGSLLPEGVAVNALSPIAATRMVRAALVASGTGPRGLDLSHMPQPEDMAPAAAYLAGPRLPWCQGQVIFSAGSELTRFPPPRLLEAVRTSGVADVAAMLSTVMSAVLVPVHQTQVSSGGTNPRFGDVFSHPATANRGGEPAGSGCLLVCQPGAFADAFHAALREWHVPGWTLAPSVPNLFDQATAHLETAGDPHGLKAVVVVSEDRAASQRGRSGPGAWAELLDAQSSLTERLVFHGAWLRAAARQEHVGRQPLRVVQVCLDADSRGGPAGQAVAQLARSAADAPGSSRVSGSSISVESVHRSDLNAAAQLAARLALADEATGLEGAELVVGTGWLGLRAHPQPGTTVSFGGRDIPPFVDDALREAALS